MVVRSALSNRGVAGGAAKCALIAALGRYNLMPGLAECRRGCYQHAEDRESQGSLHEVSIRSIARESGGLTTRTDPRRIVHSDEGRRIQSVLGSGRQR